MALDRRRSALAARILHAVATARRHLHRAAGAVRMALVGMAPAAAGPACASGPYAVDDAAITPAGAGQVESWMSLARRGHLWILLPATTLPRLPWAEWTLGFDTGRDAGARATGLQLQGKFLLSAAVEEVGDWGLAASAGARLGLDRGSAHDVILNGILSFLVRERLLLHGNLGWTRLGAEGRGALTVGARAEATLVPDRLTLHAEVFGLQGFGPGFQLGLRPTIAGGQVDLELVASHNLAGERSTWATLGVAVRF
ncbi:MAG: hypothetical protein NZM40_01055 [Sphingomonadaceae bacterium]|uniref:hypothetical protein n=1 Tax=Thermaurantiacus sp. TaxID=2820283 RepID=UPI00298F3964|nr:hypothetical protein [Thermaurantiacus sp.]MCS6986030.1 hypothetical protein [Sphingomonadaceae bacterium]MDW8414754.1 hypothetical protein [Thermaurantiacus sp.]